MIKLIDLNYHMHDDISIPAKVLEVQKASIGFAKFIKEKLDIQFIKHMNYEGEEFIDGVKYRFFKSRNKSWYIPFKTHRYIKSQKPDIVLIQGFIFPFQLLTLRLQLNKSTKFIVQHHGERPWKSLKKYFQELAYRFANCYLFTTTENATEWIEKKIIINRKKCKEVLEGSTFFTKKNKELCKSALSLTGNLNFLWVGRLNARKDPLTVLQAFEKYISVRSSAKLFMIYQTDELLPGINNLLMQNDQLENSVVLHGNVLHDQLETWYNAADFYISGSHQESTGYALLEAMACGCIPVVTNIPSFKKITDNRNYELLYQPGSVENLFTTLLKIDAIDQEKLSASIVQHFNNSLSFKSIADSLFNVCEQLVSK